MLATTNTNLVAAMLKKKVLASLFAGCLSMVMISCGKQADHAERTTNPELVAALDSAEWMFISPTAEKIIKRILNDVLTEKKSDVLLQS